MGMGNIANSGMQAAMKNMETISNNIANANTWGFKQSTANFADIFPSGSDASGTGIGSGVKLESVRQDFSVGGTTNTKSPSNLALNADGFFVLKDASSGLVSYSRNGGFSFDQSTGYFTIGNQRLQGFAAVSGAIPAGSVPVDLQINTSTIPASATTTITQSALNLNSGDSVPSVTPFSATNPQTYNFSSTSYIYDSLGGQNSLTLYYVKNVAANSWNVYAAVNGTVLNAATPGVLTFNTNGTLNTSTNLGALSFSPSGGAASPQAFAVVMSGATQFASTDNTAPFTSDGYGVGNYQNYTIDKNGIVTVNYSNGQSPIVGQVAVATFPSPESLSYQGSSIWTETLASGTANVSTLNSVNNVVQGALENSNVDLASELVGLVTAQNTFQANAQVEQVFSQIMQTVTKL